MGVKVKKGLLKRCLLGLLVVYLGWCLMPVGDAVRVEDQAGLSEVQKRELWRESFFTPWRKGCFVIFVRGTPEQVTADAGFYGGPLYAGGISFTARWVDGKLIARCENAMWIS
ncbi:hypothetical protein Rhal01_02113 [Rubritalea halochordaticola]|uniref:Uncharacterized protein n=1 Tax=Rubritalea halochordaticola TaxID=714537 RepID=A0ABP9V3M9_9BACT